MDTTSGDKTFQSVFRIDKIEMLCNCGRDEKVAYVCKGSMGVCPDYLKQTYYCLLCSQDSKRHDHKSITIGTEVEAHQAKWLTLTQDVANTNEWVRTNSQGVDSLLRYLEHMQATLAG